MAFPVVTTTTLDKTSIQSIIESEAGIADCMAQFFGDTGGALEIIQAQPATDYAEKLVLLNTILISYTKKENSIASVIKGAARKLAADNNIDPSTIGCPCHK